MCFDFFITTQSRLRFNRSFLLMWRHCDRFFNEISLYTYNVPIISHYIYVLMRKILNKCSSNYQAKVETGNGSGTPQARLKMTFLAAGIARYSRTTKLTGNTNNSSFLGVFWWDFCMLSHTKLSSTMARAIFRASWCLGPWSVNCRRGFFKVTLREVLWNDVYPTQGGKNPATPSDWCIFTTIWELFLWFLS